MFALITTCDNSSSPADIYSTNVKINISLPNTPNIRCYTKKSRWPSRFQRCNLINRCTGCQVCELTLLKRNTNTWLPFAHSLKPNKGKSRIVCTFLKCTLFLYFVNIYKCLYFHYLFVMCFGYQTELCSFYIAAFPLGLEGIAVTPVVKLRNVQHDC